MDVAALSGQLASRFWLPSPMLIATSPSTSMTGACCSCFAVAGAGCCPSYGHWRGGTVSLGLELIAVVVALVYRLGDVESPCVVPPLTDHLDACCCPSSHPNLTMPVAPQITWLYSALNSRPARMRAWLRAHTLFGAIDFCGALDEPQGDVVATSFAWPGSAQKQRATYPVVVRGS